MRRRMSSSIGQLRKKSHPHVGPNTKRIEGVETANYRVAARLVEMKLADDRDIHLVIAVPSARSAIIAACGQPSSSHFTNLGGRANITGVGFFDIPHGQIGVAPNAIELHPVLKFLAPSCSH